jgi:hypothetical protein
VRESWRNGDSGEAWPQLPKVEDVLAASCVLRRQFFFSAVTQQKQIAINYSVLVHAALGGGWPRWQPLNGAVQ